MVAGAGAEHRASSAGAPAKTPYEGVRSLWATAREPGQAGHAAEIARAVTSLRTLLRPPAGTSLNGPIGPHRRWAWARGRLADVKAIRTEYGGIVNDVVLAVITRGFRDLLSGAASRRGRVVRTMVPVSVRMPPSAARTTRGLRDVRRPRGADRGPGRAPRDGPRSDAGPQGATRRWRARR